LCTAEEAEALARITAIDQQMASLSDAREMERQRVDQAAALKQLIAGTGESFKNAVADALREIGFRVIDGPPGRADLLATDGSKIATIEAKGLEGSAREKDVDQLGRWMFELRTALAGSEDVDLSRYVDLVKTIETENQEAPLQNEAQSAGERVTGILIIGTFRKKPLSERTEADFPDNVIRTAGRLGGVPAHRLATALASFGGADQS
jgi:hypothetical protein